MSLLGIDIGTTGCKTAAFSAEGELLAAAYAEYDLYSPQPGWAQLDTAEVWEKLRKTIRQAAAGTGKDPVKALAVSSLGEAVVPVGHDRQPLGPSILNFDVRGEEYARALKDAVPAERLYRLNGNTAGNHYGAPKLQWIRDHQPDLYAQADRFLLWAAFAGVMLGGEPVVDYALANRTLLFDLERQDWSDELLTATGLERGKLPAAAPAGMQIGQVRADVAGELGLPEGTAIVCGTHDQCANAMGCGAVSVGQAAYGMGTFLCLTPVFDRRPEPEIMMAHGLNTEHHALPDRYVCFIYNQGGSLVKWYRNSFAREEHRRALAGGRSVYPELLAEMPQEPSRVLVLPHFSITGPPEFIGSSSGVMAGLRLETRRGEILKGIIEGITFYIKECMDGLPETGMRVDELRAVGGGSQSDAWVQLSADILGRPLLRPHILEAGALGAAILAGVGCGEFASIEEGAAAMVRLERRFEPDSEQQRRYVERFEKYRQLWPLLREFLTT